MPIESVRTVHLAAEQEAASRRRRQRAMDKARHAIGRMSWVRLGGGMAFTHDGYPLEVLTSLLASFARRHGVHVYLEPGEAIVTQPTDLVVTVLTSSRTRWPPPSSIAPRKRTGWTPSSKTSRHRCAKPRPPARMSELKLFMDATICSIDSPRGRHDRCRRRESWDASSTRCRWVSPLRCPWDRPRRAIDVKAAARRTRWLRPALTPPPRRDRRPGREDGQGRCVPAALGDGIRCLNHACSAGVRLCSTGPHTVTELSLGWRWSRCPGTPA